MPDWIDPRTGRVIGGEESRQYISVPRPRSLSPDMPQRAERAVRYEEAPRSKLTPDPGAAGAPGRPRNLGVEVVDRIANTLVQVETGGDPGKRGTSGERGLYQYMPETWRAWSAEHSPDRKTPLPQTPENEHLVARSKIHGWLQKGYGPEEIASMWNSGDSDWTGKVGVNPKGQRFDTPGYVEKFRQLYYGEEER